MTHDRWRHRRFPQIKRYPLCPWATCRWFTAKSSNPTCQHQLRHPRTHKLCKVKRCSSRTRCEIRNFDRKFLKTVLSEKKNFWHWIWISFELPFWMILEKEGAFRSSRGNSRFKNGIICHFQQWNFELRSERSEQSNGKVLAVQVMSWCTPEAFNRLPHVKVHH